MELSPPPRKPSVDEEVPAKSDENSKSVRNEEIHTGQLSQTDGDAIVDYRPSGRDRIKQPESLPDAG